MLTLKLTYLGVFQIEVNGQLINNFRTEKNGRVVGLLGLGRPLPTAPPSLY